MHRRWSMAFGFLAAVWFGGVCAHGADRAPAATQPGPTTAPTVDLSTPKAALLSYHRAMQYGDVAGVKASVVVEPEGEPVLEAITNWQGALRVLKEVGRQRFGDAAKVFDDPVAAVTEADLAKLTPVVHGDEATVALGAGKPTMKLARAGGQWRLDVRGLSEGGMGKLVAKIMNAKAPVARKVTEELRSGRYATALEANRSYRERLAAAERAASAN